MRTFLHIFLFGLVILFPATFMSIVTDLFDFLIQLAPEFGTPILIIGSIIYGMVQVSGIHSRFQSLEKEVREMKPMFGEAEARMDKRFEYVDKRFGYVDKRFDQVDKRFEQVDKRFEQVDKRFEQIDKRFEQVDKRFEQIDKRFEQADKRFDKIDDKLDRLTMYLLDNKPETLRKTR